jgi:predicted acyl esterase
VWPAPSASHSYTLGAGTLDDAPAPDAELAYQGVQAAGCDAGLWCAFGSAADLPPDQRTEDGLALTFTSAPLAEPVEILGFPEVTLTVAVDQPTALLAVRLCDVAPTGASLLVTRGLLNLTHCEGHEHPRPLEPGRHYTVRVRLNAIAHALPAGHRWRLAISPTYWPWAWPSPAPATLRIVTGAAGRLALPVRTPRPEDDNLAPFEPAEGAPPLAFAAYHQAPSKRVVCRDAASGRQDLTVKLPLSNGSFRLPNGLVYEGSGVDTYTIVEGDPLSARVRCAYTIAMGRGEWRTRVEVGSTMSADAADFHVTGALDAYEGNVRVVARTWTVTIPRDLV